MSKPKAHEHEVHEPSPAPTAQDVLIAIGEIHHRIDQLFGKLKLIDLGQDDILKALDELRQDLLETEFDDTDDSNGDEV